MKTNLFKKAKEINIQRQREECERKRERKVWWNSLTQEEKDEYLKQFEN